MSCDIIKYVIAYLLTCRNQSDWHKSSSQSVQHKTEDTWKIFDWHKTATIFASYTGFRANHSMTYILTISPLDGVSSDRRSWDVWCFSNVFLTWFSHFLACKIDSNCLQVLGFWELGIALMSTWRRASELGRLRSLWSIGKISILVKGGSREIHHQQHYYN